MVIFEDLGRLLPINYVCIIAFAPDLQRVSFYSVTEFLPYSTIIKVLLLHNTHKRSYRALEPHYDAEKLSSALCLLSRTNSGKAATPVGTSFFLSFFLLFLHPFRPRWPMWGSSYLIYIWWPILAVK
jgi:hypothetical protein